MYLRCHLYNNCNFKYLQPRKILHVIIFLRNENNKLGCVLISSLLSLKHSTSQKYKQSNDFRYTDIHK